MSNLAVETRVRPMKPKAKKAWVKALRSGKYRQAQTHLCKPDGSMCCLGVLYDIAVDGYWVQTGVVWGAGGETWTGTLPPSVRTKLGLRVDEVAKLIRMNDTEGRTFDQIADWVDEHL
jgi:hypothetical protein